MERYARTESIDAIYFIYKFNLFKFGNDDFWGSIEYEVRILMDILQNKSLPVIKSTIGEDNKGRMIHIFIEDSPKIIKALFDFFDGKIVIPKIFLREQFNIETETDIDWKYLMELTETDNVFFDLKKKFLEYRFFAEEYY